MLGVAPLDSDIPEEDEEEDEESPDEDISPIAE
jgi:hypothetical protein